jgi:chemotaxis-related protein WspD
VTLDHQTPISSEATDAGTSLAQSASPEIIACWSETGIYGNGSCPELPKFVHCRNCPVYSNAGLQLLNRPLPADYRQEWSDHFASNKEPGQPTSNSAILFRLQTEWLALPTQVFQEVAERRQIHSLPHRHGGLVLGLANIRGELTICISLGHLLGLENRGVPRTLRTAYQRLLVVSWEGDRLAFPVDEVHGPHRFDTPDLKPGPATVTKSNATFVRGVFYWQKKAVGLLEMHLLFPTLNRSLA